MFQYVSVGPFSQNTIPGTKCFNREKLNKKAIERTIFFQQLAKSVKFSHHCNIAMNDIQQLKVEMNV